MTTEQCRLAKPAPVLMAPAPCLLDPAEVRA